jgi:cytochrome b561
MDQVSRYHPLLVALHWVLALVIIAALALGALVMVNIPNTDPMKIEALRSHMSGGIFILILMLVRLFVRTRTRRTRLPPRPAIRCSIVSPGRRIGCSTSR